MKRGLRIGTAITCLLLIGGAVLVPASASAASLRVCPSSGPGCPFTSIQAAINAASGSASVSIAPGTYNENVTIGPSTASPVTLVAEGGPGAVVVDGQQ